MQKKSYITDLDGTLLNSQSMLSDYSVQAIEKFQKEGIPFSLATGRSYGSMRYVMRDFLPDNLPVITFDGGLISHFSSPDPIYFSKIDPSLVNELVRFTQQEGFNLFLDILEKGKTSFVFQDYLNEASHFFIDNFKSPQFFSNVKHVPLIAPYSKNPTLSIAIIDNPERIDLFEDGFDRSFRGSSIRLDREAYKNSANYEADILWILPDNSRKEEGLKEYSNLYNVKLEDIIFFGDNYNDMGVFSSSPVFKVAVENAIDPIKGLADLVIGRNDDDSVVKYIEDSILT